MELYNLYCFVFMDLKRKSLESNNGLMWKTAHIYGLDVNKPRFSQGLAYLSHCGQLST